MAQIGSIIDNKYLLKEYINKGGMSYIYLAENIRLGNRWAIKEIRKTGGNNSELYIKSLRTEARLMKDLDNPAFPRIVDIVEDDESLYLVMDYIEGKTLDEIIKEYGPQDEETVIGWAFQLCDALSYLHSQDPPVIYRDMKPSNVILKADGSLKVIDFGVARFYDPEKAADTVAFGTRGFAPPEQYSGQTDERSDIYALGMTLLYLLTGIDPCLQMVHFSSVRDLTGDLSDDLCAIIDKCIAFNPADRYRSCQELTSALWRYLNAEDFDYEDEYEAVPEKKPNSVFPAVFIIVGSIALLAAAAVIVVFMSGRALNILDMTKETTAVTAPSETVPEESLAEVPDVEGLTIEEAEETLEEAGFTAEKEYVESDDEDYNIVLEQRTEYGSYERYGSAVTLVVGGGEDYYD